MMADDLDLLLKESLLLGAGEALDEIAHDLLELRRGWAAHGAERSAIDWLDALISKAAWWSGRINGEIVA